MAVTAAAGGGGLLWRLRQCKGEWKGGEDGIVDVPRH
jgi:hypothetical protein